MVLTMTLEAKFIASIIVLIVNTLVLKFVISTMNLKCDSFGCVLITNIIIVLVMFLLSSLLGILGFLIGLLLSLYIITIQHEATYGQAFIVIIAWVVLLIIVWTIIAVVLHVSITALVGHS